LLFDIWFDVPHRPTHDADLLGISWRRWMLLLISDANIFIDMEAGQLLEKLFQLPM
jgi:hypothetical protein